MADHEHPPVLIVTLDGPAGVGKSTLAKRVAQKMGIAYLDTGAMFRTIARELGEAGLALPEAQLEAQLATLCFSLDGSGDTTTLSCNGHIAGEEIRNETIGMLAAKFAALPCVRRYLKKAQQDLGQRFSLVAEGRDMGSEVFVHTPYKFFLDASPELRAQRRFKQLQAAGDTPDLAQLTEQIRQRDQLDRTRAIAPLRAAEDALYIDTGRLDINGVFAVIMHHLRDVTA